ncbi:MAG: hybrid sensor histidine kinase/response regulator [Bacteroidota bacterium]
MVAKPVILFVDDEENNLLAFRNAYFRTFHIITAQSGEEAVRLLEDNQPDLIISDQRMPHMTGLDFLRMAKNKFPAVPRIIITAHSDIEIVIQAFNELQIYHYVLKPWSNQELSITIENALKQYFLSTENERLLQELQKANEILEQKVVQRTQQLQSSNEEYEHLNELKDKLLALITHDVRAPLANLSGFMELYLDNVNNFTPEETRIIMMNIRKSSANVQNMLNSVLSWTKNQLQSPLPVLHSYSIKSMIQQNVNLFQPIADQKEIRITDEIADETLEVMTDEGMMHLILRNLISNAIKYTPVNGNIHISTTYSFKQVLVSVSDTGMGMTTDIVNNLLSKQWVESTLGTSLEKGTGIGLHLCQEYLEKLGGKLSINSKPGQGSTFSFSLPYIMAQSALAC